MKRKKKAAEKSFMQGIKPLYRPFYPIMFRLTGIFPRVASKQELADLWERAFIMSLTVKTGFLHFIIQEEEMKENEVIYAYVRVSSVDQNVDRQMPAIQQLALPRSHIFIDKASGQDFERPQYQRMIKRLKPGNTLVVKSMDRLGRNHEEIIEQWRLITKEKQADIVVMDMPLLDTRKGRDLIGTLISDIVLQLLSYVAQTERELIRQRQAEGIAAARAKGVHLGRFPKTKPENQPTVVSAWKNGEITASQAAEALKTSYKTFMKWVKESNQ